jgi:hypothetical protein
MILREYVRALDPVALARVPLSCKPPQTIDSAADIAGYAYDALRLRLAAPPDAAAAIERIANVFSRASVRVSQLQALARAPRMVRAIERRR